MNACTPRLATLAATVTLFATLAAPLSMSAQTHTPCALLTPEQVKAVLGTPVVNGKPGSAAANGSQDCTWADPKGETRVYLALKDAANFKATRDGMPAARLVPITGLAGDAFFVGSAGTSAALYALKGRHYILLTVDGVGFSRTQNEEAEKALATELLPKL
jgi:hypothetical protein